MNGLLHHRLVIANSQEVKSEVNLVFENVLVKIIPFIIALAYRLDNLQRRIHLGEDEAL